MPRLPTYEQPTVQNRPAPMVTMRQAPAGAFGEGLAEGLQNLGSAVTGVMMKAKQEQEQDIYHGALNQVLAIDEAATTEHAKLQGEEAIKPDAEGRFASDRIMRDREAKIQDVVKALPERVKRQVLQSAGRSAVTLKRNFDGDFLRQTDVVRKANADAAVEALNTYAASHPFDDKGYEDRLGNAMAALEPRFRGLPDAQRQAEASVMANALVARTRAMLATDATAAKGFFDKHAEAMSASVHFAETKRLVEGEVNFAQAKGLADQFTAQATTMKVGEDGIGTYDWAGSRSALLESLKDKPKDLRDQTLNLFDDGQRQWMNQRTLNIDAAQAVVSRIAGQRGAGAALGSKELAAMIANPDTAEAGFALKKSLVSWQKQIENEGRENMAGYYAVNLLPFLMDKTLLANLTPDQIANLLPQIGPGGVRMLGEMVGQLEQTNTVPIPPDIAKAVLDRTTFNMKDPNVAKVVNQAYSAANDELVQAKKAGQKIDRALIETTLKANLAAFDTVTKPGWVWDSTGRLPWGGMTDEQKAQAIRRLPRADVDAFAAYAKARYGVTTFSSQDAYIRALVAWRDAGKPTAPGAPATREMPREFNRYGGAF